MLSHSSHLLKDSPAAPPSVSRITKSHVLHQIGLSASVQFSHSVLSDSMTPWTSTPGLPVYHQIPELAQTHVHRVGDVIQPSHPLSSSSLPPSVFLSEFVLCIQWPKYWSFSFSISPSNEYSGLISFRMDWLDLLAVQGSLQHHSSKA